MEQAKLEAQETLKSIAETRSAGEQLQRESFDIDKRVSSLLKGYEMSVPLEPIPELDLIEELTKCKKPSTQSVKSVSRQSSVSSKGDMQKPNPRKISSGKLATGVITNAQQQRDSIASKSATERVQKTR